MGKVRIGPNSYEVLVKAEDCGTGAGGFKPGNDCAAGRGSAGEGEENKPKTAKQEAIQEHLQKREDRKNENLERQKGRLLDENTDEVTQPFEPVEPSEASSNNYDNEMSQRSIFPRPIPENNAQVTPEAKAQWSKCHEHSEAFMDYVQTEYPELAEGLIPGDTAHNKKVRKQLKLAGEDAVEQVKGMRLHLLEQGIYISNDETEDVIRKQVVKSLKDGNFKKATNILANHTNVYAGIKNGVSLIEERFRSTGAKPPDFSELSFIVTHEKATTDDGKTPSSKAMKGGVAGHYDSLNKHIVLDAQDVNSVIPDRKWLHGSSGNGPVGMVVHEIGHQLHHRKLANLSEHVKPGNDVTQMFASAKLSGDERIRASKVERLTSLMSDRIDKLTSKKPYDPRLPSNMRQLVFEGKHLKTAAKLGGYARTKWEEFVAEAFSLKMLRPDEWKNIGDDVHKLYNDLGGP
tara:strand:- start:1667 stop:3046 length:1380 start_codon:yes stop_codon:yes gene_type:complete